MKPAVSPAAADMRAYALERTEVQLTSFVLALEAAAKSGGAKPIHDLRVSVRRFGQSIRTFEDFFPKREVEEIRGRLKALMNLSSEVRNRDIAIEYLTGARQKPPATLQARLERERAIFLGEFADMLRAWAADDFSRRWRAGLGIERS